MKKLKETAQDNVPRTSSDTGINGDQHTPSSAPRPVQRLFSGDGWTAAVTLDDAFALELLQTWSLQDEEAKDAETDARMVHLDDAPVNC